MHVKTLFFLIAFFMSSVSILGAAEPDNAISVVATSADEINPAFSWDSQKICFMSNSLGTYQIYVTDKNGVVTEQITNEYEVHTGTFANWSHDGQYITYILSNPHPYRDLYIVDVDTKEDSNLTDTVELELGYELGESAPVFSPDDSLILLGADVNYNGWFDVYTIDLKTLSLHTLTWDGYLNGWSSWSHSGEKISYREMGYYNWPSDVCIMNKDGSNKLERVTDQPHPHSYVAWSPNDSLLVYHCGSGIPYSHVIKVVNTLCSSPKQLTSGTYDSQINNNNDNLVWSPDGRNVVYFSNQAGNYDIWMVDVFDSTFVQLTSHDSADINPSFSPDGKYVVFQTNRNGNWDIYKIVVSAPVAKICKAFLTAKKVNTGPPVAAKVVPGGSGGKPKHDFKIHLIPCEPMDVSVGDFAEVFVDVDKSDTYDQDEKYLALVSSTDLDGEALDIAIKVYIGEDLIDNDPCVAIYSVNNIPIEDTLGNPIDYLCLNTFTPGDKGLNPVIVDIPENVSGLVNYPNPFNPVTNIQFTVSSPKDPSDKQSHPVYTTLKIYNIRGELVKTLVEDEMMPGEHILVWDGTDNKGQKVSSGVYFYWIKADDFVQTKKMILMK